MSEKPIEQDARDKLIEMSYLWGDIEERIELDAINAERTAPQDEPSLAEQVDKAFRVEAEFFSNGWGDPCVWYLLLYDVTDHDAREAAAYVERNRVLKNTIAEVARPWHTRDFLIVKRVPTDTPVAGQVCRRFLEDHPAPVQPDLDDVPTFKPITGSVELTERWPYWLTPIEVPIYDRLAETGLTFAVQPWIQHADTKYRVDFLVFYDGGAVAVELDGHEFHKTKDQRGSDAEKQNWLAGRKITMIRFTGTQVWQGADACVSQILDIARGTPARP